MVFFWFDAADGRYVGNNPYPPPEGSSFGSTTEPIADRDPGSHYRWDGESWSVLSTFEGA